MNGNRHISTPSLGLRHQLQALVDSGASPNLIVAGAQAAVADAKKQHKENTEKNKKFNMADNAAQNKRKFEEQMNETRQIHQAVQNGEMSKEVGDQNIRKIFGLSTDEIAQRGIPIRWVAAAITRRAASQMDVAPTDVVQVSQGLLYTNYFVKVSKH